HHLIDTDYYGADNTSRLAALAQGWQLALVLHPELRRRVGDVEIARPGKRMQAIAAAERFLVANPGDPGMAELKRVLYHDLTEADYEAGLPTPAFDSGYVERLGMAL